MSSITDIVVANPHVPRKDRHFLSSLKKAFIEHTHSLFLCCHPGVSLAFNSSTFQKTAGWKRESEPIPKPQTKGTVIVGQANGHRVRETRKNKALKTKDNRLWFAPPLFIPFLPPIHFPRCVSTTCATPMFAERRWTFLSPLSRAAVSLALFFSKLYGVSHVLSLNSFCEIRIAGFVRTVPPVIYDDSCLS